MLPLKMPNASDCYWFVAGDTTQVWSSAQGASVALTNADYLAWLDDGHLTARIGSWSELYEVLVSRAPDTAAALAVAHQAELRPDQIGAALFAVGCQIASTGTPALNGTYAIDQISQQQMAGVATSIAAGFGFPASLTEIPWPDVSGVPHLFDQPAFLNLAYAIQSYIYGIYQTIGALQAGIPAPWPAQPVTIP